MTTNPLAQDLGGVVLLPCPFCGKSCAVVSNTKEMNRPSSCFMYTVVCDATQDGCGTTAGYEFEEADAIAAWNTRTHSAEIAGALEQLRDLHDSIRTVYDAVPALPITADTMDAATDALHAFCLLVGIHRVDVGDPQPQPAMQQGGGGGDHG